MEQDNTNLVSFPCPVCSGALQEVSNGVYQCSLGHRSNLQELIAKQNQTTEQNTINVNAKIKVHKSAKIKIPRTIERMGDECEQSAA